MKGRYLASSAGLCGALVLGACSSVVVTTPAYIDPSYEPAMLSYVAKHGPLYTQVIGNPFGEQAQIADRVIATALQDAQFSGRPLTFVTERPADYSSPYKVIVLFDPAPAAASGRICANPDQPRAESAGDKVSVMVAFCNGGAAVASISGFAPEAATADAPNFDRLMRQVATEIFSPRSIERRDDNGDFEMGWNKAGAQGTSS